MTDAALSHRIEAIRRFNRLYTRQLGLLRRGLVDSPFSLTQARILYEIAHREETTATELVGELELDAGYLSRIVGDFDRRGMVHRRTSPDDARCTLISLTEKGLDAYADLNAAARRHIEGMLESLPTGDQARMVAAMGTIEGLLSARPETRAPYLLRPHGSGDIGWMVHRHGVLYHEAYGWNEEFEALVARIVADFVDDHDPRRERCWIAERDGENVGSVLLVRHPERPGVARLRVLLVEPSARGLGIGTRLVRECTRFARGAGYHTITLWTNSVLHEARRIYEREGFRLVEEAPPRRLWGSEVVNQNWDLDLRSSGSASSPSNETG